MAATLPTATGLKLSQALAQWRHWQCQPPLLGEPVVERQLVGGHSNHNVLVCAGERRFVVRIDGVNPTAHGLNRQGEWHTLQAAHAAGLAPAPRYFNPELGVLVCDYLPPEPAPEDNLAGIAALLRGIHALPACHQRLNLAERLARYDRLLQRSNPEGDALLRPFRDAVAIQLAACSAAAQPATLCHNDLLQANRLPSDGQLYALDWEYAAMGCPLYDLAVVAVGDGLCDDQHRQLLQHYLQRQPSPGEWLLSQRYGAVYAYLALAWYLVQAPALLAPAAIADRARQLEEQLGQLPR